MGRRPLLVSLVPSTVIGLPSVSKRVRASAVATTPASLSAFWIASSASSIESRKGISTWTVKPVSVRATIRAFMARLPGCGEPAR